MVGQIFKMFHKCVHWGKVFLPLHQIRYFPPRFIVRDPVVEGVSSAFKKGNEVAVIVYKAKNMSDLIQQFGIKETETIIQRMKRTFQEVVEKEVKKEEILLLDYHYSEGFTLYLQVEEIDEQNTVYDIDILMKKIISIIQQTLQTEIGNIHLSFEKGFMFVEKNNYLLQEAIKKARIFALTMAEKRTNSQYNEMLMDMKRIIAKKDILLLGQPIIDLTTNKIGAWEMLSRGPKGTNLEMPLRLFSVARQTGNLYALELIVLEKAFEKVKETGCKQDIFVNCTPLTLGNKQLVSDLKQLLTKFDTIDPTKMIIEMTEQETVDEKTTLINNIQELRAMGFRIALDDTGAGYSSLHSIGEILPEIIKIDRAVIQNIHQSTVNESMLKGILLIANEVGSKVVAEGIELEEEAAVLSRYNVDFAQGYYFSRPADFNVQLLSAF